VVAAPYAVVAAPIAVVGSTADAAADAELANAEAGPCVPGWPVLGGAYPTSASGRTYPRRSNVSAARMSRLRGEEVLCIVKETSEIAIYDKETHAR
jgi:hypothetical protein